MGTTFSITHKKFLHAAGTKDYDFVLIDCGTKAQSYLIRRWGKVNTKGQLKIDTFKNPMLAKGILKSEERKREAKDYSKHEMTIYSVDTLGGLVSRIKGSCLPFSKSSDVFSELTCEIEADMAKGAVSIALNDEPTVSIPKTKHKDWGLWA
ncbi:WGR domain-containing protein [Vibrio sp. D404a]|uniref:WGR domain-containing protein n=1 Tax=unclassified Vibrio TaxID=2614977 RepID=UPI0025566E78|nr:MULTISPECIES: WGR domain-containing protein [unclassified Vibrio]MDK9739288.1 WGR domain-containing protein [Vibrio sp. D404a]MDK9797676.1 WGR domain-containing protein [Vibrio sp. D449a]